MSEFDIISATGVIAFVLVVFALWQERRQPKSSGQVTGIHTGGVYVDSVVSTGDVRMTVNVRGATFQVRKGGTVSGKCNGKPFSFTAQDADQEFIVEVQE